MRGRIYATLVPMLVALAVTALACRDSANPAPLTTPVSGLLFSSNWDSPVVDGVDPVLDVPNAYPNGSWDLHEEYASHSYPDNDMVVVSIAAAGLPALTGYTHAVRLQQRGATDAADTRSFAITPASTDYYLRFYYLTNDANGTIQSHYAQETILPVGSEITAHDYLSFTPLNVRNRTTSWGVNLVLGADPAGYGYPDDGHGGVYPVFNWFLANTQGGTPPLAYGTWYRFEYWVHWTDPHHIQVYPRIYLGTSTTPLYQDADFRQEDYGSSSYNGLNDWTLANWYSRADPSGNPTYGDFYVPEPEYLRGLFIGNNGPEGSTPTLGYWYFTGVMVRSDTWCGP